MERKQIITIAGKPGSGKSTTSKGLAKRLQYRHVSSGDFFRALGKERGVDVLATNLMAEEEKEIDEIVDQMLRDLGATEDRLVIDSRMAWHWMPYSFRVYLDLDLTVAAERIIANLDQVRLAAEHIPNDPTEYAVQLSQRLASETKRYMNLYQANPYDTTNYDLVIDTAKMGIEEIQDYVLTEYEKWLAEKIN